jgi:hypothetical protein
MKTCISIQLLVLVGLCGSLAHTLQAQRVESVGVGLNAKRDTSPSAAAGAASDQVVSDTTQSRASRTARGALIGAGIGAGTGFVAAIIATNKASVTDHSEDGLAYIALTAFGALVGLVVGGIIGFVRN